MHSPDTGKSLIPLHVQQLSDRQRTDEVTTMHVTCGMGRSASGRVGLFQAQSEAQLSEVAFQRHIVTTRVDADQADIMIWPIRTVQRPCPEQTRGINLAP